MRILHLTDFHFKGNKQNEHKQNRIIESIIRNLRDKSIQIDYIFFTGDLVFSGSEFSDFEMASKVLITPLIENLNLPKENFFICPGNHDINRDIYSQAIITLMDSFNTNGTLNEFIEKGGIDFKNSTLPLSNYEKFVDNYFNKVNEDVIQFGYSLHKREFNQKRIGVMCLNTSWRAIGKNDEGNLIYPTAWLEEGIAQLKNCDLKILLHHHPVFNFKMFNQYEIQDLIHNNFNIALSGHLHKNSTSVHYTNNDGILSVASAATLAEKDGSYIGFTVLNLDVETLSVDATCYKYDHQEEFFYNGNTTKLQIPISEEKAKQNKFRQRLRTLYDETLDEANDLFLNGKKYGDNKGFIEIWTSPVLSIKSPEEVKKTGNVPILSVDNIVKSFGNYLIMGEDKCGKTSLLKKIQLECLGQFNTHQRIPIYFNAKIIEDKETYVSNRLDKDLATYFQVNKAAAREIISKELVILLVDNLELTKNEDIKWLEDLLKIFNYAQVIICTDQNSTSKYQDLKINNYKVNNLYFHGLKQRQLRELADKFYGSAESNKLEVLTRINQIFSMLAIPFNFWSVSLFMWVFKDSKRDITNDVDLVDLYIESILERDKLIKNKGGFGYEKYKQFLAHLARHLLTYHKTNYSASRDQIYEFTKGYLAGNLRNNTDAHSIWEYIIDKGILKAVSENRYTFRLNGVFEYFLAHYLKLDSDFRQMIIEDNNLYLSFKNELEMYAGSNRGDEEFVNKIFEKTKTIFRKVSSEYGRLDTDEKLSSLAIEDIKSGFEKTQRNLLAQVLKEDQEDPLEEIQGDIGNFSIQENCEVKLKKIIPVDENNIVTLERALYVLGRVFKNADDITNAELISQIFDYLLDTTLCWGYKLFETFNPGDKNQEIEQNHVRQLLKLMKQMLPIIVQSRISDMIGANNMQEILHQKLNVLKNKDGSSQFKMFIILYTLIDVDILRNLAYVKESISLIKMPILRYGIMMKILYYYNFRILEYSPGNQERLAKALQEQFVDIGAKFNNKLYDRISVNNFFQKLEKINSVNKKKSLVEKR